MQVIPFLPVITPYVEHTGVLGFRLVLPVPHLLKEG
jgi:hypothetical protein